MCRQTEQPDHRVPERLAAAQDIQGGVDGPGLVHKEDRLAPGRRTQTEQQAFRSQRVLSSQEIDRDKSAARFVPSGRRTAPQEFLAEDDQEPLQS